MRGWSAVLAMAVATALALPTTLLVACGPENPPPGTAEPQPATVTSTPPPPPAELLRRSIRIMTDAPSKRIKGSAAIGLFREEFEVTFVGTDAKGTRISSGPRHIDDHRVRARRQGPVHQR
jgi:hypothetical protein